MRNFRLDDESGHQEALFEWAAYHMDCMPELEYMHHIPNGGKRDKRTAVALKRQGVKAGVPDICLPVARNGYHTALCMYYMQGYTYEQIEKELNTGKDTPRRWITAAVKELAVMIYGIE